MTNQQEEKKIINLLKRNGFEREDESHYINKWFSVSIEDDRVSIAFPDGYEQFCSKNYFAVLGLLYFLEITHTSVLRLNP